MNPTPTIGRVVLFRSSGAGLSGGEPDQEVPALITNVHSDTCLNLMVFPDGHSASPAGVVSVEMDDQSNPSERSERSWRWMPYQVATNPAAQPPEPTPAPEAAQIEAAAEQPGPAGGWPTHAIAEGPITAEQAAQPTGANHDGLLQA